MPADVISLFFVTALLLGLAPGPDNIFVLTQSLAYGSRAGLLVVLGLCTGLLMHTSLVALGLAAVIATSSQLLLLIKFVGAVYLLYLAWGSWMDRSDPGAEQAQSMLSGWQLYRRGIIMNSTNPKVALFFLAFLPQFVDPHYGAVTRQIVILGFLFIVSTVIVFGGIALLAGRYSEKLSQSPRRRMLLNRLISVIFALLAINLVGDFF